MPSGYTRDPSSWSEERASRASGREDKYKEQKHTGIICPLFPYPALDQSEHGFAPIRADVGPGDSGQAYPGHPRPTREHIHDKPKFLIPDLF